jgi:hypothetical protein
MAGGIIPLRRATLSRFGGRLRQESASKQKSTSKFLYLFSKPFYLFVVASGYFLLIWGVGMAGLRRSAVQGTVGVIAAIVGFAGIGHGRHLVH